MTTEELVEAGRCDLSCGSERCPHRGHRVGFGGGWGFSSLSVPICVLSTVSPPFVPPFVQPFEERRVNSIDGFAARGSFRYCHFAKVSAVPLPMYDFFVAWCLA